MLLQGFLSVSAKMMSPLKDVLLQKKLQKNVKHAIEHNYKQQGGYLSIQRNPGSWALESVIIQLQESRIPLTIGIRNPSSIDKDWKKQLQSRIQGQRLSWISFHGAKDTIGRLLEKLKKFQEFSILSTSKSSNCDRNLLPMKLIGIPI